MRENLGLAGKRRKTRKVMYGSVAVGGEAPISIQSMTTCASAEVARALEQIRELANAGCEIVRVSVKTGDDVEALPSICSESPLPVIADIHFDYELAVRSAREGVKGLRINPGNIGGEENVGRVIEAAASTGIPVRIGVNSGSIERGLRDLYAEDPARALAESALGHMEMIEKLGFGDLVFSLKSADPIVTIRANRLFAAENDYPLHIGVTEAGPPLSGTAKSAVALTIMLSEGLGDTIRVSLSGDPVQEVLVAATILSALGLRNDIPDIVSCPTCGRCEIDVPAIAERLERELLGLGKPLRIAVMGCEVNGPGEAREADIGIAGSREGAVLFERGKVTGRIEGGITELFIEAVRKMAADS
jgi:(E)-4-hydroxy-3-methylbut-2-enyl-diphosphate synthase